MMKSKSVSTFVEICVILILAGCGGSKSSMNPPPPPPPPPAVSVSVTPAASAIAPGGGVALAATVMNGTGGVTWTASEGTVDSTGNFVAPSTVQSSTATITATSVDDTTKTATATVNIVAPGAYANTNNHQVQKYTITLGAAADVSVEFGHDTNYGLSTWTQPAADGGGMVNLYVAGMALSSGYHMRGVIKFKDGSQFTDADHFVSVTSTSGGIAPQITTTTTAGMVPQSGVEFLNLLDTTNPNVAQMVITDLAGNVLWSYSPGIGGIGPGPSKLLSNGNILINFSVGTVDGGNSNLQEVDLGGNVVWNLNAANLNASLAAATCAGCNITVVGTHHDFAVLPNGHVILIAAQRQTISGATVTGDVLIDLDENHNPVWVWNEFDHLDVNRHPYKYPDWTHTNAVIYSPDDGNLIVSIRHQNWLVKVNYNNGAGNGDVLWKLGYQGDFTLLDANGQTDNDANDWFYAQHGPSFVGSKTAGQFTLTLFDNGDDRGFDQGPLCGTAGQPACYSTIPQFDIDETAKTAKLTKNPTAPFYSVFGGNAEILANGNLEFAESSTTGLNSAIYETDPADATKVIWQMNITGQNAYRGIRTPSLYPGVQW